MAKPKPKVEISHNILAEIGSDLKLVKKGLQGSLQDGNQKEIVELSEIESNLVKLLALSEDLTATRDFLIREIWNEEVDKKNESRLGVNVFKVRKKVKGVLNIVNIRGKGYQLEVV